MDIGSESPEMRPSRSASINRSSREIISNRSSIILNNSNIIISNNNNNDDNMMNMELEDNVKLVCRICEELVPYIQLEEHSKQCAMDSKKNAKAIACDEKIAKLLKALDRRLLNDNNIKNDSNDHHILKSLQSILFNAHQTNIDNEGEYIYTHICMLYM